MRSLVYGHFQYLPSVTRIWAVIFYTMEQEFRKQEISVPSACTPIPREISGNNKDNLSPEDVHPFPKPGPRCGRRQRKKVKSRILTDSPIKNRIEQEPLARTAVSKRYCKWAKNYRNEILQNIDSKISFFFKWISLKNLIEKIDGLLETFKSIETQEIIADDFVLIQFSTNNQGALCWASRRTGSFHMYVMWWLRRHGEKSQFVFSDKGNMSEIEREDTVAELPRPILFR